MVAMKTYMFLLCMFRTNKKALKKTLLKNFSFKQNFFGYFFSERKQAIITDFDKPKSDISLFLCLEEIN